MKSQPIGTLITKVPILRQLFARLLSQRLFGNWQGLKTGGVLLLAGLMFTISPVNAAIKDIQAGISHTCVLTTAGGVKCWGWNGKGQLGDGSTTNSSRPVAVLDLSSGVSAIATGEVHSCALMMTGGVKCWGGNENGELGDGSTTNSPRPVAVDGLNSGVSAIELGQFSSCALMTTGGFKCWGMAWDAQFGFASRPVAVSSVYSGLNSGVSAIATGGYGHACALMTTGGVKCWGNNPHGQLGDGSTTSTFGDNTRLVAVSDLSSGVSAIALGRSHSCALMTTGGVKCWGGNYSGQLGDGSTITENGSSSRPVAVSDLSSGVSAIALKGNWSCALTTIGGVKCWGYYQHGIRDMAGIIPIQSSSRPVAISELSSGVSAIAVGFDYLCALTTTGGVKCLGENSVGQLGDGSTTSSDIPVDVKFGDNEEASVTPEPSTYPASFNTTPGTTSMTLNWIDSVDASGYQVMCSTVNSFTAPVDGIVQADDTYCPDGNGVKKVAQGVGTYTWTGLNQGTPYFFRIYPYSNSGANTNYKTGEPVPATNARTQAIIFIIVLPEPTAYPTGFGATPSTTSMTLTWIDSVDASGYQVMCNTVNSFTAPVDGIVQADDTNCSDGNGVKKVAQGVGTYTWAGLNPGTPYFFRIYPYSNGGANIDYKTGEPVPATNARTNADSNSSHTMRNGAHMISLMSGQTMSNINFGNRPIPPPPTPTIIRGMKWHDINGDGKIDRGEPGLADVIIFLDLNDNGVLEANEPSQLTNEQGQYVFSNLEAGTYVVREVVPTGYQQTYPPVSK